MRTGARVISISHPRREVVLESGAKVPYEQLVIATGARGDAMRESAGARNCRMCSRLYTLDDAERMRASFARSGPRQRGSVGAGYIGVEAADALRRHGLRVTILDARPRPAARRRGVYRRRSESNSSTTAWNCAPA